MRCEHLFARARTVALAALPGLALALAASASAAPTHAANDTGLGAVCANVVGLPPGERHFAACVQSLSDSLNVASGASGLWRAHSECLRRYEAGSAALAECVLDDTDTRHAAMGDSTPNRLPAPPGGTRSWFAVSPGEAFHREQMACATLGLDPVGSAFTACSESLHAALAAASNPMN